MLTGRDAMPAAKMILMFTRKKGLTMEQFIDYYEKKHAPLILSISSRCSAYKRNYVRDSFLKEHAAGGSSAPEPDVITEIHFDTQADFDAFFGACNKVLDKIANDEANFVDRTTIRGYVVTEESSTLR
jgi:uncharacterized protein (TIGR02118 family)